MPNGLTPDSGLSVPQGLTPSAGLTVGSGLSFQGFGGGAPVVSNGILLEDNTSFLLLEDNTSILLLEA